MPAQGAFLAIDSLHECETLPLSLSYFPPLFNPFPAPDGLQLSLSPSLCGVVCQCLGPHIMGRRKGELTR